MIKNLLFSKKPYELLSKTQFSAVYPKLYKDLMEKCLHYQEYIRKNGKCTLQKRIVLADQLQEELFAQRVRFSAW